MLAINGGPRHLLTDIGDVLPKYVINKVISSTGAAFTSLLFYRLFEKSWSLLVFINGAITGMVSKQIQGKSTVSHACIYLYFQLLYNHLNWLGKKNTVLIF